MNDGQFVMPDVYVGCLVECSRGKTSNNRVVGTVYRKKSRSVDIRVTTETGIEFLLDCWHEEDPWVESRGPDAWEENTRGTWRLSQGELRNQAMAVRLEELCRRVTALEQSAAAPQRSVHHAASESLPEKTAFPGHRWKRAKLGLQPDPPEPVATVAE